MKWKTPEMTTEQRGFTGVYDAEGHRADVIRLLQGGRTSAQLISNRKLTPDEILAIRAEYRYGEAGQTTHALAVRYGVAQSTIWEIVNVRRYREVA